MQLHIAVAASCLLAAAAMAAHAQQQAKPVDTTARYRYRLLGVYDDESGAPIEGAEVRDLLSGLSSPTSATGTVSLFFLPDSGSLIRVRKIGYDPQTLTVAITPTDTAPITVTLHKSAQQLPTVNVTGKTSPKYISWRLRDAQDRVNRHAGGHFIDEDEMRKLDNETMTDALSSRMPGLITQQGPHAETYLVSSRHPKCFVAVYIDGNLSPTAQQDFRHMSPQDYAIAEFYASSITTPAEFGQSKCGTLLLWTRER